MPFPNVTSPSTGLLPIGDGNEMYWEVSGNPSGTPVLYVHGGPGSGISTSYRRHYDPDAFFVISFEQRGCGRSRPLVTDPDADLASNTTSALVADMEALRCHLGVTTWLLTGVSWGTTLALAYAQAHPDRVRGLVLAAVTTTTAAEVEWITEHMRRVFPREWERFATAVPVAPGRRLIDTYDDAITHPDPQIRAAAARAWCEWEDVHVSLDPKHAPDPRFRDPQFRLVFATLVIHYWSNAAFLEGAGISANMDRISRVPGVLIHGRLDVSSPLQTAWDLHRAWPASELVVVDGDGHGGRQMSRELTRAIARLADR